MQVVAAGAEKRSLRLAATLQLGQALPVTGGGGQWEEAGEKDTENMKQRVEYLHAAIVGILNGVLARARVDVPHVNQVKERQHDRGRGINRTHNDAQIKQILRKR